MDDIPTCTELGYEFVAGIHRGFAVTPGTPDDIVDYLEAKIKEVYDNPAFIEYMNDTLGFNTVWTGHDEYESLARELVENFHVRLSAQDSGTCLIRVGIGHIFQLNAGLLHKVHRHPLVQSGAYACNCHLTGVILGIDHQLLQGLVGAVDADSDGGYPEDTITMIVSYAAGAGSDLLARALAQYIDFGDETPMQATCTASIAEQYIFSCSFPP